MEKTKKFKYFLGIDVSKGKLDIFDSKSGEFIQINNDKKSIESFAGTVELEQDRLIIIDLTGGYEALTVQIFYELGFCVHRAEGVRVKAFLRAIGQRAKTDKIDAFGLAEYGDKMQERLVLYHPMDQQLIFLVGRLNDLKNTLQQERNRLVSPCGEVFVRKSVKQSIAFLGKQIALLNQEVTERIKQNTVLSKKKEVLTSVIGVGDQIGAVLLAFLPELGRVNRRQIAALSGVAPFAKDSGTLSGYRRTNGGRKEVKRALFICALVAVRCDPKMKKIYDDFLLKGKKKMVAMVAVMRRMVIILNLKCKELECNP